MKPMRPWPAVLAALLLAACQPDAENTDVAEADEDAEEAPAIPVEVAPATHGDIYARYSGTAPIEAFEYATVIAKAGATCYRRVANYVFCSLSCFYFVWL